MSSPDGGAPSRPDWPQYLVGQKEHLHALGIIAVNFNELEGSFLNLFSWFLRVEYTHAIKVFDSLRSHHTRLQLMRSIMTNGGQMRNTSLELVEAFLAGFEACAGNRNALMHAKTQLGMLSLLGTSLPKGTLTFVKPKKSDPADSLYAVLSLDQLQRIADDIRAFYVFGSDLYVWLHAQANGGKIEYFGGGEPFKPSVPTLPREPTRVDWERELGKSSATIGGPAPAN